MAQASETAALILTNAPLASGEPTPGPWTAYTDSGCAHVFSPQGTMVADCNIRVSLGQERREAICQANARLVAAAPAMLSRGHALVSQLSAVLHRLDGQAYSSTLSALNDFRAALRKAEAL